MSLKGARLVLMLKLFLMRELRLSESEAMNFSFAKACHHFFAHYEQQGAAKIVNEDEREELGEHDRLVQEILEEVLAGQATKRRQSRAKGKRK